MKETQNLKTLSIAVSGGQPPGEIMSKRRTTPQTTTAASDCGHGQSSVLFGAPSILGAPAGRRRNMLYVLLILLFITFLVFFPRP